MEKMTKIQKLQGLFPIAFKNCKDVKSLILSAVFHALIPVAYTLACSAVISLISAIIGVILAPLYVICYLLCFVLIGIPLIFILAIVSTVLFGAISLVATVASSLTTVVTYYSLAGTVLSVLAYIGVFGEIVIPEKAPKKKKEEKKIEE